MKNEIKLGDYAIRRKSSHEPEKWVVFLVNETYVDLIKEHPEDYAPLIHNGCYWVRYNAHSPWEMAQLNKYAARWIFFDGWRLIKDIVEVDPGQVMRQCISSKSTPKSPDIVPSIDLNKIGEPVLFAMKMMELAHSARKAKSRGETVFLISIPDKDHHTDQEMAMKIQSLAREPKPTSQPINTI